jgi:RNA polymerase sigma factor (sigma-70 family)
VDELATSLAPAGRDTVSAKEVFADFYRRMFPGMVRLARVLVVDLDDATDLVQDAFSRVYPKYERIAAEKVDAYLRSAVLNACRRHLRRRGLARRHHAALSTSVPLASDHVLDAVRALRPDRRDVVLMRFYLGLSSAEIAETLSIAPGTVRSRLHRALRELEEALR